MLNSTNCPIQECVTMVAAARMNTNMLAPRSTSRLPQTSWPCRSLHIHISPNGKAQPNASSLRYYSQLTQLAGNPTHPFHKSSTQPVRNFDRRSSCENAQEGLDTNYTTMPKQNLAPRKQFPHEF